MTEWRECELKELADFNPDSLTAKSKLQFINYLDTGNITKGKIDKIQYFNLLTDKVPSRAKRIVKKNDIIYSAVRPNQEHYGIIKNPVENMVVSTGFVVLRAKEDKCYSDFLYYFLTLPENTEYLSNVAEDSTTAYPSITPDIIMDMDISLPPLPEQIAIAEVLSSLDDKIDLLTRQNKTLEDLAQTYFRKWFIEDSAKSRTVQISDIIDFNPPRYLAKGTIAPYLEMANVSTSVFHPDDWYNREYSSGTKFVNGDTLFARITPCLENGKSTYVTFLNKGQVGWGSTEFIVMHTKNDLHPFLSYLLTKNEEFRDHAESCLEGSSGRQRVNIDHLLNFKIQVPNEKIAQTFNLIMEDIVLKLHHNFMQIRTLSKLRDILLPKLISGEIRVKM